MPPVLIGLAAVYTAYGWIGVAVVVVMAASISYAAYSMATMPDMPGYSSEVRGRTQVVRSAVVPRRIIYGTCMVSGPLAYALSYGPNNRYLALVILFAAHEVESIGDVYLGDKISNYRSYWSNEATESYPVLVNRDIPVVHADSWNQTVSVTYMKPSGFGYVETEMPQSWYTVSNGEYRIHMPPTLDDEGNDISQAVTVTIKYIYAGFVKITKYLGTDDQEADADLIANSNGEWTTEHRLRGIAYVVVRLEWDNASFPLGIPNIKAVVKGKKVYDPRTAATAWSDNWALCMMDYLTAPYGLNCTLSELDVPGFIAAANVCDEDVWCEGPDPFNLPTGGVKVLEKPIDGWSGYFENRFSCNGAFNLDSTPVEIMKKLLTGAAGNIVWSQGLYKIFPAVYVAPDLTFHGMNPDIPGLTESDLRGSINIQPAISRRDKINTIRGTYVDPLNYWQQTDFPIVQNDAALAADGQELATNVELPYTISAAAAQRLAKIHLERGLQTITVMFPAKMSAFELQPGDTVPLTISQLGWSQKLFKITSWALSEEGGVDLMLREEAPEIYDWNSGEQTVVDPAPNTTLPDPWTVAAPSELNVSESLYSAPNGAILTRALFSWTGTESTAADYDVYLDGLPAGSTRDTSISIDNISAGIHTFAVLARNAFGVKSAQSSKAYKVLGKTAPPTDITGLTLSFQSGFACLTWDKASDLDVQVMGAIVLKHTTSTSGAWDTANVIGRYSGAATAATVPAASGTYLVKAEDSSGNQSLNAVVTISDVPTMLNLNEVVNTTQAPGFAGTKSNCTVSGGVLTLTVYQLFDSITGNFDSIASENMDDWPPVISGTYDFDTTITLSAVSTCILSAMLESAVVTAVADFDSRTAPVDSWRGMFDAGDGNSAAAILMVSTSQNGSTWTSYAPMAAGEYRAKAFKFRLNLYSYDSNFTVNVSAAYVRVDMQDIIQSGSATVTAAGLNVTYPAAYYSTCTPHLSFTIFDAVAGDYAVPSSVTATGFNIAIKDQSNIPVERTINWFAKGY